LSGLFLNHESIGLAIFVNSGHRHVRPHFSYAHEYAHALFDRRETVAITRQDNATTIAEKRANAFAAALLMPVGGVADQLRKIDKGHPSRQAQVIFDVANNETIEVEIRSRPGSQALTYQDVAGIAHHFAVSYEASVWRLKSLNYLSAIETNTLIEQKEIAKRYIRLMGFLNALEDRRATEPPEQEVRVQLTRLAIEPYRQREISRTRLMELAKKLNQNSRAASEWVELGEATRTD
jgi:Zn-dependent peptidase ImmA (M78 family)